jgi:peptidoglycan/LPS O-acetylase OafA/YrhL
VQAPSTKRANNFGFLRLAFATLVILAHSPEITDGNRSRELLTSIFGTVSFGEVAVDGFFLISGYLITMSWEKSASSFQYLMKRVLRIYPGFVVAFLITLLVVAPIGGGDLGSLAGFGSIRQAIRIVVLRSPQLAGAFAGRPHADLNGSMWTIAYEFRCYIATMALGAAGIIGRRKVYLGITVLLLAIVVAFPTLPFDVSDTVAVITGTLSDDIRFFAIFFCGGVVYLFRNEIRYRAGWAALAFAGLCAALFSARLAEPALAILGAYALFWFTFHARVNLLSRIDNRADLSYGVYLYAWPVQKLIQWEFGTVSPWTLTLWATLGSAVLATASWFLVERPFLNMKRLVR